MLVLWSLVVFDLDYDLTWYKSAIVSNEIFFWGLVHGVEAWANRPKSEKKIGPFFSPLKILCAR